MRPHLVVFVHLLLSALLVGCSSSRMTSEMGRTSSHDEGRSTLTQHATSEEISLVMQRLDKIEAILARLGSSNSTDAVVGVAPRRHDDTHTSLLRQWIDRSVESGVRSVATVRVPGNTSSFFENTTSHVSPRAFPYAENGSYYGERNANGVPKTVSVEGYFRKDGTYVQGHYRSRPGSNP